MKIRKLISKSIITCLFLISFIDLNAQDIGIVPGFIHGKKNISNFQLGIGQNIPTIDDDAYTWNISYSFPNVFPSDITANARKKNPQGSSVELDQNIKISSVDFLAGIKFYLFNHSYEDKIAPYLSLAISTSFVLYNYELDPKYNTNDYLYISDDMERGKTQLTGIYSGILGLGTDIQMNSTQYLNIDFGARVHPGYWLDIDEIAYPLMAYSFRVGYQFYL